MAGTLKSTVVVRHPETLEAHALLEGSEVPDWATDLVHPDNLGDGGSDSDKGYDGQKTDELQAEVDKRNADREDDDLIEVTGTGKDGRVLKADLVAALEADDAENA